MSPRQARLGVHLFTAAVVASVGVALAGLTWRLAGDPGERMAAAPVAPRALPPPDIAAMIAAAPFGAGAASPAGAADASLVLKGILMAEPHSASTALVSVGGAVAQAFSEGQALGGGTIVEIAADHVVIAVGAEHRLLAFPDRTGGGTPAPVDAGPSPAPPAPPAPTMPGPAGNPSPQSLLQGLGATPAPDGFHVTTPSPQMRAAGIQPGDVIQRLNGQAMVDVMTNPATVQTALANGTARVDVVRAGVPLTLSIPLR